MGAGHCACSGTAVAAWPVCSGGGRAWSISARAMSGPSKERADDCIRWNGALVGPAEVLRYVDQVQECRDRLTSCHSQYLCCYDEKDRPRADADAYPHSCGKKNNRIGS